MIDDLARLRVPRRLRHRLGPVLDRLARRVGQPEYYVYPVGYVGTVHLPRDDLEAKLQDGGFTWDPFSLYHYTPTGSSTDGSWVYRSSPFADRQLHVVLFSQSDHTHIYAHDEFNWLRHPLKHAKQVDIRREQGVDEMRRWLSARGIEFGRESVVRRRAEHLASRVRERVRGRDVLPVNGWEVG